MAEFKRIPADAGSLSRRKTIYGVGHNDASYLTSIKVEGHTSKLMCPYYKVWHGMLRRCYSDKFLLKRPTYKDCTVSEEWLYFSAFLEWMEAQPWKGNQLDKDIILPGNKHYSPETCCFISNRLNSLLTRPSTCSGKYPNGVIPNNTSDMFTAKCCGMEGKGKTRYIGSYATVGEAYEAHVNAKVKIAKALAEEQTDPRVKQGILDHIKILIDSVGEEYAKHRDEDLVTRPQGVSNGELPQRGRPGRYRRGY